MATPKFTCICRCGCGQPTRISKWGKAERGYAKGQPRFYVRGHQRRRPASERFWPKVQQGADSECWNWIAGKDTGGYGLFKMNDTQMGAHRASYILKHGAIENGKDVLHNCDNPACVNPAHLFLGTHKNNMADMVRKGRHCHKLTAEAKHDVLTSSDPQCVIARRHGIHPSHVSKLRAGLR